MLTIENGKENPVAKMFLQMLTQQINKKTPSPIK